MGDEVRPTMTEQFDAARRKFLKISTGILAGTVGLVLGLPFVASLLGPRLAARRQVMVRTVNISSLTLGQPTRVNFTVQEQDAYIRETAVNSAWVIVHSPEEVTVFSPICPHAGCYFNWDSSTNHFECPCHGSIFSIKGKVLGGPAPRSLDTLSHQIKDGELYIKWERSKSGTPEKIEM